MFVFSVIKLPQQIYVIYENFWQLVILCCCICRGSRGRLLQSMRRTSGTPPTRRPGTPSSISTRSSPTSSSSSTTTTRPTDNDDLPPTHPSMLLQPRAIRERDGDRDTPPRGERDMVLFSAIHTHTPSMRNSRNHQQVSPICVSLGHAPHSFATSPRRYPY